MNIMTRQFKNDDFTKLFNYMQQQFKLIDARFDKVDQRFNSVEKTLDQVMSELNIKREEDDVKAAQINGIDDVLDNHETRITDLEQAAA
jgi:predicted transcriptional regulator